MLTVLAIEESLMYDISNFEPLLKSVANSGNFKICSWKREETTLENAIPALFDREFITEGELINYNIMIVSDNRNCYANNPFDGDYSDSDGVNAPYDKKLNELTKMLGIVPAHSMVSYEMSKDKSGKIKWNIDVDKTLSEEKLEQYKIKNFTRPRTIYLMAVQKKFDVDVNEFVTEELAEPEKHALFRVSGRYPSNCRFFKFNLSSASNKTTMDDYFRLSMTILSVVYNDGADEFYTAPDTLYTVDCDINEDEIASEITEIYSRVHYVKRYVQNEIQRIHKLREYNRTKHYDMPHLDSNIVVEFDTNEEGLFLDKSRFGLSKNCPVPDDPEYDFQREKIEKRIREYLKAPVRALRKAVVKTKELGVFEPPSDEIIHLSREQTEDLDESIENIELELVRSEDINIDYPKVNEKARKESDKKTHKVMEKRSKTGTIIVGSLISFAAFLAAFAPYIYNVYDKSNGDTEAVSQALGITLGTVAVMAVAGFITLVFLRIPLSDAFRRFKSIVEMLIAFVQNQAHSYSKYLSTLAGFMKRNSFKRYLESDDNSFLKEEEDRFVLNRNHCESVESLCSDWANGFNFVLKYNEELAPKNFLLNDSPKGNTVYSFIVSDGEYGICYNKKKSCLSLPYRFVSSLNVKREEVYE